MNSKLLLGFLVLILFGLNAFAFQKLRVEKQKRQEAEAMNRDYQDFLNYTDYFIDFGFSNLQSGLANDLYSKTQMQAEIDTTIKCITYIRQRLKGDSYSNYRKKYLTSFIANRTIKDKYPVFLDLQKDFKINKVEEFFELDPRRQAMYFLSTTFRQYDGGCRIPIPYTIAQPINTSYIIPKQDSITYLLTSKGDCWTGSHDYEFVENDSIKIISPVSAELTTNARKSGKQLLKYPVYNIYKDSIFTDTLTLNVELAD